MTSATPKDHNCAPLKGDKAMSEWWYKSPEVRVKAIDMIIKQLNQQRCPVGEWPTVSALKSMRADFVKQMEEK